MSSASPVRLAADADADAVGRLLYDFNAEFDEPAPEPSWIANRLRQLFRGGDTAALVAGEGPDGFALLRFRESMWSDSLECYLAELYVVPRRRRQGLGRALMEAAIDLARERGATYMDLATGDDDTAARALYESLGFSNRGGDPERPVNYYYEKDL